MKFQSQTPNEDELMDPFVHTKDWIFEMLKNSQLPWEQYPGFQAASNYTNVIRQAEYCSNVARWR